MPAPGSGHIDLEIGAEGGIIAARDFGGRGPDVLLVHGTGHDLEAWGPVADLLVPRCHVVAFDLRGHGQTTLDSTDATQYWRDLGGVIRAAGLRAPILVGHSTGGYAVTAFAADGGDCAAIVVVDGFVPDDAATVQEATRTTDWPAMRKVLWDLFRYGWQARDDEMEAFVREVAAKGPTDWLNAGVDPARLEAVTRRAFLRRGDAWLRRPTMKEIDVVRQPAPGPVYPSVEVYSRVRVPLTLILASGGLYANRVDAMQSVAGQGPFRRLVRVQAGHNVPLQAPSAVAAAVREMAGRMPPRIG